MNIKSIIASISIAILFICPVADAAIFQQSNTQFDNTANKTQDLYQVELIIFNYQPLDFSNNNLWQDFTDSIPTTNTITLINPFPNSGSQNTNKQNSINLSQLQPYTLLPANLFLLGKEMQRLQQHDNYQILTHLAWLQPISDTWHAKTIYLVGGNQYQIGNTLYQLNGTLRLTQANYINVSVNLELVEPVNGQLKSYHLQTYRRMRPNQLNYIDSPVLGMLVMLKPLSDKKG